MPRLFTPMYLDRNKRDDTLQTNSHKYEKSPNYISMKIRYM